MGINHKQPHAAGVHEQVDSGQDTTNSLGRFRWRFAAPAIVLTAVLGAFIVWRSLASTTSQVGFDTTQSHIKEVSKVGRLAVPANIVGRDGGGSVVLGGKILWLYGDTFYHPNFSPNPPTPDIWRSATSSYSDFSDPYNSVQGGVDSRGNPLQVIPLTAEEAEYNRVKNNPTNDRYVIWPSGQITQNNNTAVLFFLRFLAGADKSAGKSGIGVATLRAGEGVATRQPGLLFGPTEPAFRVSMVRGDYVYLYATECGTETCPVARALISRATERSAYTFWDGTSWNMDVARAKPVVPVSNYGYTVMWSDALGKYVQAMIGNFSRQVYFSFANEPQGPWSSPVKAFEVAGETTYVPYFHPELSQGNAVYMTYTRNNDSCKAPCTDTGGIEVMKITFNDVTKTSVNPPGSASPVTKSNLSATPLGQPEGASVGTSSGQDVSTLRKTSGQLSNSSESAESEPVPSRGFFATVAAFFVGIWQTILGWFKS